MHWHQKCGYAKWESTPSLQPDFVRELSSFAEQHYWSPVRKRESPTGMTWDVSCSCLASFVYFSSRGLSFGLDEWVSHGELWSYLRFFILFLTDFPESNSEWFFWCRINWRRYKIISCLICKVIADVRSSTGLCLKSYAMALETNCLLLCCQS